SATATEPLMKSARIDARPTVGQFSLIGARRSKGIVNEEDAAVMADRSESFPAAQGAKHPHKYLHLQERSALPGRVRPLACLTVGPRRGILLQMALSRKKATTIALDHEADQLLTRAACGRGVPRSEFIRQQLRLVLAQ